MATFTRPVIYSGIYAAWYFNPHIGYADDSLGANVDLLLIYSITKNTVMPNHKPR